jgi:hypothetical protein
MAMDTSLIWIVISLGAIAIVALLLFVVSKDKDKNRLTPLAGSALAFILAGILFGEDKLLGYSLMGVGVALAFIDMYNRSKRR